MNDVQHALFPLLVLSAGIAWLSAMILVVLARQQPRIGFLVERAVAAVVLATATTAYALVAHNSDHGYEWLDSDTARVLVRLLFIGLGLIPVIWLGLYLRRRV